MGVYGRVKKSGSIPPLCKSDQHLQKERKLRQKSKGPRRPNKNFKYVWIVGRRYWYGGGGVSDVSAFILVGKYLFLEIMTNIIQWNVRGIRANVEELRLLCNQYNPQIVAVQECQLRKDKIINLTGFSGLTKSSPGDNATGGVTLYVNKSVLFSEIKLDTDLQAVAVRVSPRKL